MFLEIFSIGCLVAVVFFFCKELLRSLFSGGGSPAADEEDWLMKARMRQDERDWKRAESHEDAAMADIRRRWKEMNEKWG